MLVSNSFKAVEYIEVDKVGTADTGHDGKPATINAYTAIQHNRQTDSLVWMKFRFCYSADKTLCLSDFTFKVYPNVHFWIYWI